MAPTCLSTIPSPHSGLIEYALFVLFLAGVMGGLAFYWRWLRSRQTWWKRFRNGFSLEDLGELKTAGKISTEEFERLSNIITKPAPTSENPLPPSFCPDCGHDLRATPDRCPECGLIMSSRK